MFLVVRHINLFSKSILIPGGDKKQALLQSKTAVEESLCILPRLFFIATVILKKNQLRYRFFILYHSSVFSQRC